MLNFIPSGLRFVWAWTMVLWVLSGGSVYAQLVVTGGLTQNDIKNLLFGPDVTITNFQVNCPNGAFGSFDGTNSNIGLNGGIILTTGNIGNAVGPNNRGDAGTDKNAPGDTDLDNLVNGGGGGCTVGGPCTQQGCNSTMTSNGVCTCTGCWNGGASFDACSIEFDITPTCDEIQIRYVFGSEEYPEYVNANVSDAFAFLISGPGINGMQNIALVPGTSLNVEIDNINANTNNQYYVNNANGPTVQYDAFTVVLTATMSVVPCETYHLKIVIADYGDGIYDSGVFLEKGGINCGTPNLTVTATDAVECCTGGSFTLTLDQPPSSPLTVAYTLGGTATDGVDYTGLTGTVTFPAGQTTITLPVSVICDQLAEGQETIELFIGQSICGGTLDASATLLINDGPVVDAGPDQVICSNGAQLNATGSGTFQWTPPAGLSCTACPNPVATPAVTTTYYVTLTDANGCTVTDSVTVIVTCGPTITATGDEFCLGNCGTVSATPLGGTTPYTVTWNPNAGTGPGPHSVCPAATTRYYVTVTDNDGNSDTTSALVVVNNAPILTTSHVDPLCAGLCNGSATVTATGNGGFVYQWDDSGSQTTATATGLCVGTFNVTVADANGCESIVAVNLSAPNAMTLSTTATDPLCNGSCDGSASVTASGGTPNYSYRWDDASSQTAAVATGLCAGTYQVTVTDNNGCASTSVVTLNEPPAITASVSASDVNCNGACDGTATVTAGGGTGALTYQWNDAGSQTTAQATGLCPGNYTATVTDAQGCTSTSSVTVNEPPALVLNTSSQVADCGVQNGSASVTAGGGSPGYTYLWDDPSAQTTATATGVGVGTYNVTVTDSKGCTATSSTIVNEVGGFPVDIPKTDVACNGACNGMATANPQGGNAPYNYNWNNGQTTAQITGLCPGTYSVTITDVSGCSGSQTVTITEPTALQVAETHTNVSCSGGSDGSVDLTASGATPPLSFAWSNGATAEDLNGIPAGSYCVTVTDANACTATLCVTVTEPAAMVLSTSAMPTTCGKNDGSVSVGVTSGGTSPFVYVWSDAGAQTSAMAGNLYAGSYCVTVTDANGCSDTACVTVPDISNYPVVCFTDSIRGCIPITTQFTNCSGAGTCLWDFGDNTTSTDCNPTHTFTEARCYDITLTVTSPEGCSSSLTRKCYVEGYAWPTAHFEADPWEVNVFNPVINFFDKSTDASSWTWYFGDGDSSTTQNPVHVYKDTGCFNVRLVLENQYGCTDEIVKTVCVKDVYTLYVPNAFTPNGDGENEWFAPKEYGVCELEMFIFDRWGNQIFETSGMQGWDGRANGGEEPAQEDVYVWIIRATFCDGEQVRRVGHVTLIR